MIQDISPKVFKNQYSLKTKAEKNDKILVFSNSKILVKQNEQHLVEFPVLKDFLDFLNFSEIPVASDNSDSPRGLSPLETLTYLFSVDDEKYFLLQNPESLPKNYDFVEVRELRKSWTGSMDKMMAAYTGKHLADWYRDTKFCGRCGKPMIHSQTERAMTCPCCNYTAYPRIMPAVIVGILNNDKIVLTKYKTGYQNYALVAGFIEIGETAEQAVAREVMEETGLKIKNIRYYKSQPWGIANDLLLGYYCVVDGSTDIHVDEIELKSAEWMDRTHVILQPDSFSLTNEMMKRFKDGLI